MTASTNPILKTFTDKAVFAQFLRHSVVGGLAYLLFFAAISLAILFDLSANWMSLCSGLAFGAVSVLSYFLHRSFVYRSSRRDRKSVILYTATILAGALSAALVGYLAKLYTESWNILICQIIYAGLWAIVSNTVLRLFVFSAEPRKDSVSGVDLAS